MNIPIKICSETFFSGLRLFNDMIMTLVMTFNYMFISSGMRLKNKVVRRGDL